MKVVNKKLEELTPYENNPRNNQEAIEYVANSIKNFGFKVPIVVDKNNVIVCGHTRYESAKRLGMQEAPCVVADDLTDEQIKAYRLADNKVGEVASWDFEALEIELEDIDMDMGQFGFNTEDVDSYIDDLIENEFAGQKEQITQFSVSFIFDKKYETLVNNYIKDNGKEKICQYIIDKIRGESNA